LRDYPSEREMAEKSPPVKRGRTRVSTSPTSSGNAGTKRAVRLTRAPATAGANAREDAVNTPTGWAYWSAVGRTGPSDAFVESVRVDWLERTPRGGR